MSLLFVNSSDGERKLNGVLEKHKAVVIVLDVTVEYQGNITTFMGHRIAHIGANMPRFLMLNYQAGFLMV